MKNIGIICRKELRSYLASPMAYVVTAVFLDEDPTAVVVADGKRTIVHVGDELGGARVTSIGPEGVTIKGADGVHTYTYSAAR